MGQYLIKLRRGFSGEWAENNPTLSAGEPGFESDTGKFKIGDGITKWTDLEYFVPGAGSPGVTMEVLMEHVNSPAPHPVYDDGPSLLLLYENAKV